jgi:taurine dioxygenase
MTEQAWSLEPADGPFGAVVHGIDLAAGIDAGTAAALRRAWLDHQVLVFVGQDLTTEQFEAFASAFGPIGDDPYFVPRTEGSPVVALSREADETSTIFADVMHSDWSFLASPPAGTVLHALEVPPVGGDTLFADQYGAYASLPPELAARLEGLHGVHSARHGYSRAGAYGERDQGRTMAIRSSDEALATQVHPLVRVHPETGRPALFVSLAYTIGIDGMDDADALGLIDELLPYTQAPEVVYRHRWQPGMVVLWDNRCLLHAATGGYEGHRRELLRLTIAERSAVPDAQHLVARPLT